ncbi:FAD/NAD(P)-binding oxidoreductase [Rhodanobacter sp. DHB23]|uniref:NAD(P)/FAD-dependent oxidoreductase n=1 Tax=Rhodanobacter sp. DHB23 TaxID=2775923 RepID=UPI00178354C8|nr:FAD/NAD(P)-binding oxidoreductase [Rhodanobacter sp. DHB23]MBD8874007.1 NAD(P)/FAD-dependent oxidoreductase [Rhodanobacter sp. DHB23]
MAERYDVLVVGAGPAGLAAAQAAAGQGARVAVLDAQPRAGGQVWRHDVRHAPSAAAARGIHDGLKPPIEWLAGTSVVAAQGDALLVQTPQAARWLHYGNLVLATGARELLLPFPGWTLPGVVGAGAAQALAKQGWPLAGKRVVVAGSGPLLLAAATTLRAHGAHVVAICEQAEASALRGFAAGLWRWPGKLLQAGRLRLQLAGVPYRGGTVVQRALPAADGCLLRAVGIAGPRGTERLACDMLAVGYGLIPNMELARLLGCATQAFGAHAAVQVDARQHTSLDHVYAAGEACGIGGVDCARIEGAIAGLAAAGAAVPAGLLRRRGHARAFAAALRRTFALRPQVHALASADTLVCRCEDVTLGMLDGHADFRSAKLATRCGMGACQGRICGAALAELGRFPHAGSRPPLFPARLSTLAHAEPAS